MPKVSLMYLARAVERARRGGLRKGRAESRRATLAQLDVLSRRHRMAVAQGAEGAATLTEQCWYQCAEAAMGGAPGQAASMLGLGHASATREEVRNMLMDTGGQIMARGALWDIKSTHLGAGIYRVTTERHKTGRR